MTDSQFESFLALIEADTNGCWRWRGNTGARGRYGLVRLGSRSFSPLRAAHRIAYEAFIGDIPAELELDHLCRETLCVNPTHLEPVTHAENVRRGRVGAVTRARLLAISHCPKGHPYDEANTLVRARGSRDCRACNRDRMRAKRAA